MQKIKIEVWSDIVCPYCYIGKHKLERALKKLGMEEQVEVIWRSFMLDPDFPKGQSVPATEYLIQRKGFPREQMQGMYLHLAEAGKPYGIDFQFEKCLSFNTLDAHRLWQWSAGYGKQHAWKAAAMKAYFSEGEDLSRQETLLKIAGQIGLDREEAAQVLASGDYFKDVENDIRAAQELGIRGVPFFLLNRAMAISGAQDDRVFERMLALALQSAAETTATPDNAACTPDGCTP